MTILAEVTRDDEPLKLWAVIGRNTAGELNVAELAAVDIGFGVGPLEHAMPAIAFTAQEAVTMRLAIEHAVLITASPLRLVEFRSVTVEVLQ